MATALFGVIFDQTGNYSSGSNIVIRHASRRPIATSSGVSSTKDLVVSTNTTGFFRTPILPGTYFIWIDGSDYQKITIPAASGDYLLEDLIIGGSGSITAGVNYRDISGQRQLLGSDGLWYIPEVSHTGGAARIAYAVGNTLGGTANFQTRAGLMFELLGDDGLYYAPIVQNNQVAILSPGATPFINTRISANKFQLYDTVNLNWRTWFIYQSAGALGPAES
jgi:hypothetical protein